ncbi:Ribosomal L18p/L5e family [Musa troglodytarum]|uniref:Ribosomal L18p/L5e family n=1 Tax=Musa troglodytarum TaxID=320322 RepID=A0A9E7FA03_9LILI|nr:Ribosomal L18p/L5e family [Musa troglodytarum]
MPRISRATEAMRWIMEIGLFHVIVDVVSMTESFFGVEDFVDDDNSRPYTYKKEKRPKNPQKHISFKQHTIAYMEPFSLDGFISKRFISASVTHGVTCKQVAVAGTNSKDIKAVLKSRERDKFEGKLRAVVQSLGDNGIDGQFLLCVYFSGSSLRYNCQLQPNSQKHSVLEKK